MRDRSDPRIQQLEMGIETTLVDVFGADTLDYQRYSLAAKIDRARQYVGPTPPHEVLEGLRRGKEDAQGLLSQAVRQLEEAIGDSSESPDPRAGRAFEQLDLHPEIARGASALFQGGRYTEAIEAACKALDGLVKLRSGRNDLDGAPLMQQVFSVSNPILAFSKLEDDSDRSEQQGMMNLFAGAMLAFRNPRAHKFIEDHPEAAVKYIQFISMLAGRLDGAMEAQ